MGEIDFSQYTDANPFVDIAKEDSPYGVKIYSVAAKVAENPTVYAYKPLPEQPLSMRKFFDARKRGDVADIKHCEQELKQDSEIKKYKDEVRSIAERNYSNAIWLERWARTLWGKGNKTLARKLLDVYKKYPDRIALGNAVIWRRKQRVVELALP